MEFYDASLLYYNSYLYSLNRRATRFANANAYRRRSYLCVRRASYAHMATHC